MALDGTYDGLKASIAQWCNRTDLTAIIPDFITIAEDMFNNGADGFLPLRTTDMEATDTITITDGVGSLPADYLEYRSVRYGSELRDLAGDDYQIVGSEFQSSRNGIDPISLGYYARIPGLSEANQTNWLLTKSPRIYLFGSLLQAEPYMKSDARIPIWAQMLQSAVNGLVTSDFRSKYARATIRTAGTTP